MKDKIFERKKMNKKSQAKIKYSLIGFSLLAVIFGAYFILVLPLISANPDLTDDIYLYFKFDQTATTIDSVAGLNTSTTCSNVTGKIGNAYECVGEVIGVSTYKPYTSSINAGSYNVWLKTTETVRFDVLIQDGSGTVNNVDTMFGTIYCSGAGKLCLSINRVITVETSLSDINNGEWHMVTFTVDGTTHRLYIDGLNVDNATTSDNIFGGKAGGNGFIMGTADGDSTRDEVGVWNRSLTNVEVTQLYNGGAGLTYPFAAGEDVTPPTFDENPVNISIDYGTSISQKINGSDETEFDNYAINWTYKYSIGFDSGVLTNISELEVGIDLINITINDTSNNIAWVLMRVEVNQSSADCQVLFNETSSLTFPATYTIYTDCISTSILTRNGTVISNDSKQNNGAGYWNFSVQRTDTVNYSNTFDDEFFRIDKATPTGTLTNTDTWTEPYLEEVEIGFSESNTGDGDVDYIVYREGVDKDSGETVTLGVDTYDYVLNTTGGANYSSSASLDAETLTITAISPSGSLAGSSPINYLVAGNVEGTESNTGDGGCSYKLYNEGVEVLNPDNDVLGVGVWNYIYNTTGCTNYSASASLDTFALTVNKIALTGTLAGDTPIDYLVAGDVEGTETNTGDGDVTYKLYREGVEVLNPDNDVLGVGVWNYIYNSTGGANYSSTASIDTFALTVDKISPSGSLTSDLSWTINESQEVEIGLSESNTGDGDLNYIVYRDNVAKSTGETWSPALGTYDYVLNTTGGANWTANASMDVQTLTVNDITNPSITIIYPTATTYSENISELNYTYIETNPDSCWYSTNNGATNSSAVNIGVNFTNVISVGDSNTWWVYCNDTSDNLNVSSITFSVNKLWYNTGYPFANKSFRISEFINVSGTNFTLGGEPYKIIGANFYYAIDYMTNHTYTDNGEELNNSAEDVYEVLNEMQYLGINVIRTWGTMAGGNSGGTNATWEVDTIGGHYNLGEVYYPGNYNETFFKAFDKFIYESSQRDIRLQIVLINNWEAYGGMQWYLSHSTTSDKTYEDALYLSNNWWTWHDQFYTDADANTYFQDTISYILNRNNTYSGIYYKDDPAIFSWMIANEPRAKTSDHTVIADWCNDTATYIKSIDSNHLVTCGIESLGFNETWGEGADMISTYNNTASDYITFAMNTGQWGYMVGLTETSNDGVYMCLSDGSNCGIGNANVREFWAYGDDYTYNSYWHSNFPWWTPNLGRHGYSNWVEQNVEWANEIGKPVMLQELVIDQSYSDAVKDDVYLNAISNFYSTGGDGIMLWTMNSDSYYRDSDTSSTGNQDDGYGFYLSDDSTLKTLSASSINAIQNATDYTTSLNSYKYDFVFNVGIASDTVIDNCTLYLNVSNGTWSGYYADQSNSTNIVYNEDYTFTKQFESNDEEFYWYTKCYVDSTFVNSSVSYVQVKSTTPVISLVSPGNDTFHNGNPLNLFYNVTNDISISFCELYVDDNLNKTDYTISRDITQSFSVSGLSEAAHNWFIKCTDIDSNEGFSGVGNFTIDLTPPTFVTIPANTIITYGQGFGVYFDATDENSFDTYAINWTTLFTMNSTGYLENSTSSMAVGTYLINVTINDTANNVNSTIYNVTVSQSSDDCGVWLNDTSPITYQTSITVHTNCTTAYTLKLSNLEILNNTDYILGVGLWNFSVQRTDTVNYSNIYYEILLTVDKAVPTGSLTNSDTWTEPYLEEVTIGFSESNIGDGDVTYKVYRDGDDKGNEDTVILGVGTYDYVLKTTGGANWTANANMDAQTLTVTKISPSSNMDIDGTTPIIYPTISDFSGSETNTGDGGCSYSMDRSNRIYGVDTWTFEYSTSGCANYTSGDVSKNLVVNQNTTYTLLITGTTPIGYGIVTDVVGGNCPTELSCSLDKVNKVYAVGTETFNYSTPGNTNYSGKYITKGIVINKGTLVASITNNKQDTFFYDGSPVNIGISESNVGDGDVDYILWKDGVNIGTSDAEEDIGIYNYLLNSTGGVNYSLSASLDTLTLTIKSKYPDLVKRIIQVLQALIVLSSVVLILFTVRSFYEEERTLGEMIRTSLYVGLGAFLLILLMPIMIKYIADLIV